MKVISYTLRDIKDEESYMESMGQARTSEVLRDARIGKTKYEPIIFMSNLPKINESIMLPCIPYQNLQNILILDYMH